jgi:hypothetical protein
MKNEPLHNILNFSDWPNVPKAGTPEAPAGPEGAAAGLEVNLADVVRDVLGAMGRELAPPLLERHVHIRNFRSDKYKLVEDLAVAIEETGVVFIARSFDTGQYGTGVSVDDSIEHLCSVLETYYELLQEERENLSRPLASHLRYLDAILRSL